MKRGVVGHSPIPTQPTHLIKCGKSNFGDVVDGGHLRVRGEDPQVVPPPGLSLRDEIFFLLRTALKDSP